MIIDFQHHYVPYELAQRHGATGRGRLEVRDGAAPKATLHGKLYDLETQLADMDEMGIDVAVLSCFIAWDVSAEECRFVNTKMAEAQSTYPRRFVGLAHIPAHDSKRAVGELKYAVSELGLRGTTITSQVMGHALDWPELFPVYEAVADLNVPIFVHPAMAPKGYALAEDHDLGRILVREFDLCLASVRLIAGGVLETFPSLQFVMAHFGGGIAAIKERLVKKAHRFDRRLQRPFEELFNLLYFDMAGFEGGELALNAALAGISPDRLVFATDYPQDFTGVSTSSGLRAPAVSDYIADIRARVPAAVADKILGGTAARLLRLA
jgi:predicted TIM-barrel fold metal-dependent hydrolase